MTTVLWAFSQLLSYSVFTWFLLIAIAYVAACAGGWKGVIAGHFVVALVILILDVRWMRGVMSAPGWSAGSGPDMDFIFHFGVLIRVILINTVLLIVSAVGLSVRRRTRAGRAHASVRSLP